MAIPAAFEFNGLAATNIQLVGALVITFAVIGFGEAVRGARLMNVALGLWLLAAPWLIEGLTAAATWSVIATGLAVVLLSLRRGVVEGRFGGWDRYVV